MNAVLFYFFGTFPLGSYLQSSQVGQATRSGYSTLENAARSAGQSLNRESIERVVSSVSTERAMLAVSSGLGSLSEVTRQGLSAVAGLNGQST
jgi:hypothetical protein